MNNLLISASELHKLIQSPSRTSNLLVFDCRFSLADHLLGRQQYERGHIPSSFHLDMENDLAGQKGIHGGRHPLPNSSDFENCMNRHGLTSSTTVVTYDDNRIAGAARLWWLLKHFGHNKVMILDGGYAAWQAAGYSVSNEATALPGAGTFTAKPNENDVVDRHWMSKHLNDPDIQIVDSREEPRYAGREEPIDPVAGHIPSAINAPWQKVTNDDGIVKTSQEQKKIWEALGTDPQPVVYCGSGVTASVNLFSMELAGQKKKRQDVCR